MRQASVRVTVISYDKGIPFVTGKETLISSGEFSYIKPSFANNYENGVKRETPTTRTTVFELLTPATLDDMFAASTRFEKAPYEIAFTEAQIVAFVRAHRAWMHEIDVTRYFLMFYRDHVVVAAVFQIGDHSFGVDIYSLLDPTVWGVERPAHIVLPR